MVEIRPDDHPAASSPPHTPTEAAMAIGHSVDKASPPPPAEAPPGAATRHSDRQAQVAAAGRLAVGDETDIDSGALTQSSVATANDFAFPPQTGAAFSDASTAGQNGPEANQTAIAQGLDPVSLPADPSNIWQSTSSRRFSQFSLVVTLAIFGLVVATVAFVQFARS